MANTPFGFGAMGAYTPAGQKPQATPDDPASKRVKIEGIAAQFQIPPNILMAFDEAGERDIAGMAAKIASETKAGRQITDIVPADLMNRAYDIADQVYPRQPVESGGDGSFIGSFGKQLGGSLIKGAGASVEMLGIAADELALGGQPMDPRSDPTLARRGTRWLGDYIKSIGTGIQDGVSDRFKRAMQDATPEGDITKPSTWDFGKDPSLTGYAMLAADVFGSMLPVIATAVITRSPASAATAGGLMGGGFGAEQARTTIQDAAKTKLPDGRTALEANSKFYRDLLAQGFEPDVAQARTEAAAERLSGIMTAPVSAFGGAATGAILTQPVKGLASRGIATRIAGTGALSSLEEGTQEVAETIASNAGLEAATGMPIDKTAGTFADFILGALGGGGPGAVGGAFNREEKDDQQNTGADGSGVGNGAAPGPTPPGVAGAAPPMGPSGGPAPAPAPVQAGPIGRASSAAPDLTPVPDAPAMFPDMKPGSAVKLMMPDTGEVVDAVFQREEGGNAIVRIDGEEIDITPQFFDEMRNGALKSEVGPSGTKPKAAPAAIPGNADAASTQGAAPVSAPQSPAKGQAPALDTAAPAPAARPEMSQPAHDAVDFMEERLAIIEESAGADSGPAKVAAAKETISYIDRMGVADDADLAELRANLARIIDGAAQQQTPKPMVPPKAESQDAGVSNERPTSGQPVGEVQGTDTAGSERDPGGAVQGATDTAPVLGGGEKGMAGSVVQPKPDAELAQGGENANANPLTANEMTSFDRLPTGSDAKSQVTIENIREKAAVVRGRAENDAPSVEGVSFKWDAKAKGWIFSRKHVDKVRSALMADPADVATPKDPGPLAEGATPEIEERFRQNRLALGKFKKGMRVEYTNAHFDPPRVIRGTVTGIDRRSGQGIVEVKADGGANGNGYDISIGAAMLRPEGPGKAEVEPVPADGQGEVAAAAAETEPNPTPAQAEAENFKTGKAAWNGLTLSVENQKDSVRRKKTPDGKTDWEVTMPAHYGRILGTTGADGDHVDFYMGDNEASQSVWLIDQMDADTGRFDEHKAMLGFDDAATAADTYKAGFSDGNGAQRLGGIMKMTAEEFTAWVKNGKKTGPFTSKGKRADANAKASDTEAQAKADDAMVIATINRVVKPENIDGIGTYTASEATISIDWASAADADITVTTYKSSFRGAAKVTSEKTKRFKFSKIRGELSLSAQEAVQKVLADDKPAVLTIKSLETGKTTSIDVGLGPLRDGYERVMVKGSPSTDQTRTTRDGFVVVRQINKTSIRAPQGQIIWSGAYDASESMVDAEIAKARDRRAADANAEDQSKPAAASVPVADARKEQKDRDARAAGKSAAIEGSPREAPSWMGDELAAEWLAGYAEGKHQGITPPVTEKPQESPSQPESAAASAPATGILSALSDDKQKRAAELKAKLAAKVRSQTSSGIDPDYIILGGELVALYIEAGTKKFAQMLRDFAESTGLSMREAQAPMRAAYNFVRDEKDLAGEDVSDMDSGDAVMAEIRKALAEEKAGESPASKDVPKPDTIEDQDNTGNLRDEQHGNQEGDQGKPSGQEPDRGMDGARQPDGEPDDNERGKVDEDGAGEPAGDDAGGSMGNGPGSVSDGPVDARKGQPAPNFIIADDFPLGEGTEGQKLAANLEALRLVRALEAENRYATQEEQAVLARWVGWGGLKTVFDGKHEGTSTQWGRAQAELRSLLSTQEYVAAMRSTNDAHYTSRAVVKAMWRAMRNFGFDGGRAIEPTIGSGNFLGLQPADLSENTEWYASELDPTTGLIAKHLYPKATVFDGTGFQDAPFRRATFDVAIGNPPFGQEQIGNKKLHPDLGKMKVHNFIIAKTGQLLREGGVMSMVVTHRFLDTPNPEARKSLAPDFHFLGAVRLPNTAFEANANTQVTTDIVFFQKRREGDAASDATWLETGAEGPNGTRLNRYFAENPDMILGRAAMDGTMYAGGRKKDGGGEFTVHADGRDMEKSLNEAIDKIEATIPTRDEALEAATTARENSSTLPYGAMVLAKDGRIYRGDEDDAGERIVEEVTAESFWKDNAEAQARVVTSLRAVLAAKAKNASLEGRLDLEQKARDAALDAGLVDLSGDAVTQSTKAAQALSDSLMNLIFADKPSKDSLESLDAYENTVNRKRLGTDGFQRLSSMLDLRQKTRELISLERADAPEGKIEAKRRALRRSYLAFKNTYGYLNNSKNEAILRGDVGPELALELGYSAANKEGRAETAKEAPILKKRVIYPHKMPESVESVADGLHVSMQERGYIDPVLIGKLTGQSTEDVVAEMTSGSEPLAFRNPKTGHFEIAEVYLSGNLQEKIGDAESAGMYQNVPHLKNAMPPPKTQDQITPSIRSLWIPASVFGDFLRAIGYSHPKVELLENVGMATVEAGASSGFTEFGQQFETERRNPGQIFEAAIKGKIPVVYDTIRTPDGDKRVKNEEATREAVAAYERMSKEFPEWAYSNPERAGQIIDAFNEKMNVVIERKYQGVRYLRMVGNSPEIDLRNSQKNGAWRMIQDPVTLLHHVVGAGKTFTAIAGIMERKRMGLTRKAVVAVPNHLTGQWGREWLELYPAANILVPTEKDFEPANRAKLINRIATGDFDAVIIGHSQLTKIDNDPVASEQYVTEQISELEAALQQAKASGESKRSVGQIGTKLNKLQEKLQKLQAKLAENADTRLIGWQDLGVDYLAVDEAHLFKNLEYTTTATQLVGMNPSGGSQRAFDLLMKVRTLQGKTGGGVAFLTGTPVSNSLVEIYSMMKYLIPGSLASMNINSFDSWKAAFIQDESRFEYTASMQLKERNIMSGMINLGPLSQLYRSFADIVMRPDVERMFTEQMEARNALEPDASKHVPTRFPTPKVKGGARRISLAPPTEKMKEFVRYLVMRMAGIKQNKANKAYMSTDNALWVLTDARKASVDIRTIDPTLGREEGSKVDRSSAEVFRIWTENADRKGAQMVFCDMSAPTKTAVKDANRIIKAAYGKIGLTKDRLKDRIEADSGKTYAERWGDIIEDIENLISSPETDDRKRDSLNEFIDSEAVQDASASMFTADTGFSFYDDMKAALIEKGVPEKEIAFIHDYDTTIKKAQLFDAVNEGNVRVLLGSTQKMGAGTNAQRRLVALHHIDAPWRPSDMEQREGRIIRQGNLFYQQDPDGFEVEIIAYSTEQTADVVQWQVLERKASSIETFMDAAADNIVEEGGDADQYASFMAQSTGKAVFLQKMQAEKDRDSERAQISSTIRNLSEAERFIAGYSKKQSLYAARVDAFLGFKPELIGPGADTYLSEWDGEVAAYRAERERVEAERDAIRKTNADLSPKERIKLPEPPAAPLRWEAAPTTGWEKKVYDALSKAQASIGVSDVQIPIGGGFVVLIRAKSLGGRIVQYLPYLVPPNNREIQEEIRLLDGFGTVDAKDFRRSDKLLQSLSPANIAMRAKDRGEGFEWQRLRHEETLPQMQAIKDKGVDKSKVIAAEERLARLAAMVRVEEVKFAAETANAGANYFASMDDKGRDLVADNTAQPVVGDFEFSNAGETYVSQWGAPNGTRRVEGTDRTGAVVLFEGKNSKTDANVIIEAIKSEAGTDGAPDKWSVLNVWDVNDEADSGAAAEMRESRPPVATLTGNELGAWEDIRQLAKKAGAWYRENLTGKSVVNKASGKTITFTNAGAKKLSGRKGDILYRSVPALRQIIADGVITSVSPEIKGRTHIKAWHSITATIMFDGSPRDVVAHVMETDNGHFHYDLSRDTGDGARFMREGADTSITDARYGLDDSPVELNLDFAPSEINHDPQITDDDLRAITRDLNAMPELSRMGGRVPVRVVRRLVSRITGDNVQGRFNDGPGNIEVMAGAPAGERGVMRHEVIHALRSAKLWNKPFGLFTGPEWRALAVAARAEPDIVAWVKDRYPHVSPEMQIEEMVAELYRLWSSQRDGYGAVEKVLLKIEGFLTALANLLRGRGFVSAARTMEQIATGKIGGRGPDRPGGGARPESARRENQDGSSELRAPAGAVRDKFKGLVGFRNWSKPGDWVRNAMTDAVTGENMTLLALVPGRSLFAELGRNILSAKGYLRTKEEMDAFRNEWHALAADKAQKWVSIHKSDPKAAEAMADLMHRSTLAGVDPTIPDYWGKNDNFLRQARIEHSRLGSAAPDWAKQKLSDFEKRQKAYATIKGMYDALPEAFRDFYKDIKHTYERMADDFDRAIEDNMRESARRALKQQEKLHRKEMKRIKDDGLEGVERDEAIEKADKALARVKMRANMGLNARVKSMRKQFESQRLKGPYFPLARFGNYFVTVRDESGKVISFSRFESERQQQVHAKEMEAKHPNRVTVGLLGNDTKLRDQVDPKFVADIEAMMADIGASDQVMDAIWQRYLETMPDQSIRTTKIHRKGREGWNRDALRAFTSHMFHGAHQLARLKYGEDLKERIDDARDEARVAKDPNRATALVNEMARRMDWTMNPTGAAWSAGASSLAFLWYLGASPASALVNISQTTVIGPAVMKAAFKNGSTAKAIGALARAAKDFGKGRGDKWSDTWSAENSPDITQDEFAALKEGYRRGTIDKTQSHDLASVAESGVEFNPTREKWMRRIGFFFHHAERVNREVTFLANYRLAREDGMTHVDAIDKAADLTWKIHFSYQNSDRPRVMQGDIPKVLLIFRQFTVNSLFRLFRDTHQSLNGATEADRKEARTQLIGISLSMMAHAGIRGVWGYGLIMGLLSIFFPGDADDLEEWMQDALLMEGDSAGVAAWNFAMGAALNGVPGQITGADLTNRIGMPDLWFRSPDRDLEGRDAYHYWLEQLAGPIGGIGSSLFMSAQNFGRAMDTGDASMAVRGIESAVPKFVRDIIKTGRYAVDGVQTYNGDDLIEDVSPWELLLQANGFTPARLAERYDINSRLKNKEKAIVDERKSLHRSAGDALRSGQPVPDWVMAKIRDFNRRFPEYPITGETIKQSVKSRIRSSDRNEFGVSLNPKLNDRLRGELAPSINN